MAEFRVKVERDGERSFDDQYRVKTEPGHSHSYGEHDDRWSDGGRGRPYSRGGYRGSRRFNNNNRRGYGYPRRGSGGPYRGRGRGRGGGGPNPRSRVDDDGDDLMGDDTSSSQQSRFNPYGRPSKGGYQGRGKYEPGFKFKSGGASGGGNYSSLKRLGLPINTDRDSGDMEWFKIIIPWGKKADKDFVLKNISSRVDVPFIPTYYHLEDNTAVFFVSDRQAADAIRSVTKKITMPSGHKMTILVKNSYPPNIPMGDEEVNKLKIVMSNRYDPATKTLNLSSLHTDNDLCQDNLYMALARVQVMTNVVKIIKEHIPELCLLDLSNNKLVSLEHLAPLVPATVDVKAVNLSNNKLPNMDTLRRIHGWKLEILSLEGNPLCDKSNDRSTYISAVRKVFPKVIKLDGNDLPPPITFDIEARTDLPKSKDNYFPNATVQGPIVKFLKDYITVYDSVNRNNLVPAYHDQAMFSLSMAYNGAVQYKQNSLTMYIDESRNLKRQHKDPGRKHKLLKKGSLIVPQLCLLPKTTHDPNSFMVDCHFVSDSMMCFTVQGVFKEMNEKSDKPPIRDFSRTFVTVPGGASMLIVNDMLTISNASPDQIQAAFKNPAPTPSSSPVPQTSPTSNPFVGSGFTEIQQQMIVKFVNDSKMNMEFSMKCLVENGWDYEKAGNNFLLLQQQGKIPPEAFIK